MPLLGRQLVKLELNLVLHEVEAQLGPGGQVEHLQDPSSARCEVWSLSTQRNLYKTLSRKNIHWHRDSNPWSCVTKWHFRAHVPLPTFH